MMTEDEKQIIKWRRERRNHCQFSTQRDYDRRHEALQELKTSLYNKEINREQAIITLQASFLYGKGAATRVVNKWLMF